MKKPIEPKKPQNAYGHFQTQKGQSLSFLQLKKAWEALPLADREEYHELARKDALRYVKERRAWVRQKANKYIEFLEANVRNDPDVSWSRFVTQTKVKVLNSRLIGSKKGAESPSNPKMLESQVVREVYATLASMNAGIANVMKGLARPGVQTYVTMDELLQDIDKKVMSNLDKQVDLRARYLTQEH